MALAFRLIARLDIKAPNLIKTMRLEGVRVVGDPAEYARRYDEAGIDELFYIDTVASLYQRNALGEVLQAATNDCFVAVTAGGGIRSVDDAKGRLRVGADKIAVNTAAIARPELITEIAEKFGSQAMVVQIDAKAHGSRWEAVTDGGREPSGKDAVAWAEEAVERGAGEVLLTSVDREGTGRGFDLEVTRVVAGAVSVPVVASGGFGRPQHAVEAARAGASGIAIAGALHYGRVALTDIRAALKAEGISVR